MTIIQKINLLFSRTPEATFVRKLDEKDSEVCNSIWNYRYIGSESFIRSLILVNGGYGLFSTENNELLSFAIINDHFATGILTTNEKFRGKKYGEFVAKLLSLKITEDLVDIIPTCYIDSLNPPSLNLYRKLGYKKIGDCNWIVVGDKKFKAEK
jgi:RimJ/RimL family protein N-acetyltransferase